MYVSLYVRVIVAFSLFIFIAENDEFKIFHLNVIFTRGGVSNEIYDESFKEIFRYKILIF